METSPSDILEAAKQVLDLNDRGDHTTPSDGMYPHQWLWDSCFIAIGLRHTDVERAKTELLSLLSGQWSNGMLPNMIMSSTGRAARDAHIWRSWINPHAPENVSTSGITQPPMLAEAIVRVGEKLNSPERRQWYKATYLGLLNYHQWLYRERDPHSEGLVLQIHPWETGLDNTPPWTSRLREHQLPLWIRTTRSLRLERLVNLLRHDTQKVPSSQRLAPIDALAFYSVQRRLRRKRYDIHKILAHSLFAIEDASFNAIFIRANQHLKMIAKEIGKTLPTELVEAMERTEKAFDNLWDPYSQQYYSREFITHKLIKVPSIATLIALYSGTITKARAKQLVKLLEDETKFGSNYPVPSVPVDSEWFKSHTYWQGPSWVNTNWLIIDGLRRYGFNDHAEALTETTLEMIQRSGFYEYFSPIDGSPAGIANFSWTAALAIDLLKSKPAKSRSKT